MAYEPTVWVNGETAITAARLNKIENGIADIELLEGPQGDPGEPGADGADGEKGEKGDPGDSHFTAEQATALLALLEE